MEFGLMMLRLVVGLTVAAHGAQKLFGWFGGHGLEGTAGWLESMGFRNGRLHAFLVGGSEFGGGLLLALGLLTPLGAAAVIGVMIVAVAIVHWENGFFSSAGGYEFNLLIVTAALVIAIAGPGMLALGPILAGMEWGFISLVVAGIASGIVLGLRSGEAASTTEETSADEEHAERRAA